MIKILNLLSTNKFIGYLFVGGFNTVMSIAVFSALLWLGMHYMLASSTTYIFGVLEGYTLNSILVFREKPHFKSLLRFTLVYCISLVLNLLLMDLQVELLHMGKLVAQIITCMVLIILNFYLVKVFVYRLQFKA